MTDLPDDILERIDADTKETVIEPLATILYAGDRAWYTKNQLNYRLREEYNVDVSKPAMTERLDELQELELVDIRKVGGTNIYYWNHDESDWPIPNDVLLQSEYNDLIQTFDSTYAWYLVFGMLGILAGGIMTLVGAVGAAGIVSMPINPDNVIAVALFILFLSYVSISLYLLVALVDITIDSELPEFLQ